MALLDSLTGLVDHRALREDFPMLAAGQVSAIMLGIDGLKSCNDQFGHKVGDIPCRSLPSPWMSPLASSCRVYHCGGDESLAIVQVDGTREDARNAVDHAIDELQRLLGQASLGNDIPSIRLSFGCVLDSPATEGDLRQMPLEADRGFYLRKCASR